MDRVPYVYKLTFKPQSLVYIGSATRKNCNPNDFWVSYFTSSKVIKELMTLFGCSNDIWEYEILKSYHTYESLSEIVEYEHMMIHELMKKSNCLNLMCFRNGSVFTNAGHKRSDEFKRKLSKSKTGVKRINVNHHDKRVWTFKHMDTNEIITCTRKKFIEITGLTDQEVYNIVSGRIRFSKRWGVLNVETNTFSFDVKSKAKVPNIIKTCEYCSKSVSIGNYSRWHGKNCKHNDPEGHLERTFQISNLNSKHCV